MARTDTFDAVAFKEAQRDDWQTAAPGWRKWYGVLEAEAGGQAVSRKLVDLAGIGPGDSVLDVGTGYGEPALTAASAVAPRGRVVATDIAVDFLDFGRERAAEAGLDNVEFLEADAEALAFDEETFDAIVSRQGLQFLPDVAGTLQRFHSFLKRGGRLAAAVWGPPDTVQFALPIGVIFKELELPLPPPGRPGIFALADADALAHLVAGAGYRDVETGTVTADREGPTNGRPCGGRGSLKTQDERRVYWFTPSGERLCSDAEVERYLRSVAPGAACSAVHLVRSRTRMPRDDV